MAETTLLINAVAAVASIAAAVVSGRYAFKSARAQIDVARINSEKDVLIQREKFDFEAGKDRVKEILEKLQEVHETASFISASYSQTRSHMDWTDNVDRSEFRLRHRDDCVRVHRARSIVDVYLSGYDEYRRDIELDLSEVYGQMNIFWGRQEELLRNDDIEDEQRKETHKGYCLTGVIEAGHAIEKRTAMIREKIVEVAATVLQARGKQEQGW